MYAKIRDTRKHNALLDTLEKAMDENSVTYLLQTIAEICSAKADHIATNWHDDKLGEHWNRKASRLLNMSIKFANDEGIMP